MAVTRKPKPASVPDESAIQELIRKGGTVAIPAALESTPQLTAVLLRLPSDMLARIDASVKRRLPVRISRVSWIIEALQERLTREENDII
jgi:hypothetical protein